MKRQTILLSLCLAALMAAPAIARNNKFKHLPPGLQKKAELPPGWQKKLVRGEILDEEIYRHGVVYEPEDSMGVITIKVDGKIIKLMKATREILEVF